MRSWVAVTLLCNWRDSALEVSPFDTLIAHMAIAVAELHAGRFDEALKAAARAGEANPSFSVPASPF